MFLCLTDLLLRVKTRLVAKNQSSQNFAKMKVILFLLYSYINVNRA